MRTCCGSRAIFLDQLLDGTRDGGGEKNRLPLLGRGLEDQFDVVAKTHVEHHVHLVEDDHLDGFEPQRAAPHVVHDAARRADDDLRALFEAPELAFVGLAAVNRQGGDAAFEERKFVDFLRHLHGQLARRAQDEHLHRAQVGVGLLDGGNGERGGLAGAGLGLADHVLARHEDRDGGGLDRRALLKAQFINGFQQFGGKAQLGK